MVRDASLRDAPHHEGGERLRSLRLEIHRHAVDAVAQMRRRLAASGARKRAGTLLVIERAAAGRLGAVMPHDLVLLGREQAAPLRVRVRDLVLLVGHGSFPWRSRISL